MDSTKKILRSILTANPVAMTVQQLNKDYRNTIGQPIPYQKYGYNSLEHFFRSIPDTLLLEGSGPWAIVNPVVSEKSSHVMELVSRQKVERKKGNPNMKRLVIKPSQEFLKQHTPPTIKSQSQKIVYPTTSLNTSINSVTPLEKSVETKVCQVKPSEQSLNISEPQITASNVHKNNNQNDQYMTNITKTRVNENVSKMKLTHDIQKINRSHMPRDYKSTTKQNGNSDTSRLTSDITLQPIDSEDYVPDTVKKNLKALIGKYPEGIWCAQLPGVYRNLFKRELNYQDLGFRNLIDLCTCLKSIFHFVRPSTEDFKLYDRSKPLPASAEKNFTVASYSAAKNVSLVKGDITALPCIDWSDILGFLPPDIFKPGLEISRTFVPDTTKVNDTIDVKIGEVFDVSKFWVYRDNGVLDQLMDDMQVFYEEHAEKYRIPRELIREGLYCVCVIFGEYHRALVVNTSIRDNGETMLFYIDYGTIKSQKVELYFLHEQFAKLPTQTIRCRLAGIWPPEKGAPWSFECTKEFKELIKRRDVTAKINDINWKDQYLEIFLADVTDSDNVFYINDVLVERGYAKFLDEEQKNSIVDSISTPIVNLIHLFPTFLELEHGLAPSTYEMEMYYGYNIPIHFCYPQYFYTDYAEEENIIEQVTDFFESHVIKSLRTDIHHNSCLDIHKLKDKPIDMSYFKELEEQMSQYMLKQELIEENCSYTDRAIGITEKDDHLEQITKKIEQWKANSVKELHGSRLLSEDIMNDILSVCKSNSDSDPNVDYLDRYLERSLKEADSSLTLKHHERLENDCQFYDGNLIPKSDRLQSENSDSQFLEESIRSFENHPFNELSPRSNSLASDEYPEIGDDKFDQYVDDFENCNRSDQAPSEQLLTSNPECDLEEENYEEDKVEEYVDVNDVGEKSVFHPTNPFLSNILQQDEIVDKNNIVTNNGRIHSTNPFLSYVPELREEHSDEGSDSTSYDTCLEEIQIQKTWSSVDMHVSQYFTPSVPEPQNGNNRSLCVKVQNYAQSSTTSHPTTSTSHPTTSTGLSSNLSQAMTQPKGSTKLGCDVNQPEFYPQNYYYSNPYLTPPAYPYSIPMQQYAFPYLENPYYTYAQQQVFMRSTFMHKSPNPPAVRPTATICPPPGFGPNSNVHVPQSNGVYFYEAYNEMLKNKLNS